jgi:glycosyltransferase involved in cell wall biosynthesis
MKLLIIDPDITLASPAMKGVIRSFPEIRAAGFEIDIWCWRCDEGIHFDHRVKLPVLGARLLGPLQAIVFSMWVTLLAFVQFRLLRKPRPDVIYSIVPYLADCDVAHAHFSPWDWEVRMREMGSRTAKEWLERGANLIMRSWTQNFLRWTRATAIIVPSDSVAEDFRRVTEHQKIVVLPNSYDPVRFNLSARERWRSIQRQALGYSDEKVFLFVSAGHYRRKGFFLAVKSIEYLHRDHPKVRLLVVGGIPSSLAKLKVRLNAEHPGWQRWLQFTGSTPEPEKYMAAADALLFPSYSEAFALVEVEAAACGLPLFLTRHHGSEMILENGVNGSLLDFDAAQIAKTLDLFVTGAWVPQLGTLERAMDRSGYANEFTQLLESNARPSTGKSKTHAPSPIIGR